MIRYFRNRNQRHNVLALIFLTALCLVWMYPFAWALFASFKESGDMFMSGARLWPRVWTLENYRRAWVQAKFDTYFWNTVLYSVSSTVAGVLIAAMCGYVLARYRFPGCRLFYALIAGMVFLPTAATALPTFAMMNAFHLLNTRWAIVLALIGGGGLPTLLFSGFFGGIPNDLYDAAVIDGANFVQQFRLVLPLAQPIIATTVIFNFMGAWNNFFTPLIFSLGKPEIRTLAVGLRAFSGEFAFDWTGFAAGTMISVLPIVFVFLLFQRQFVNGLAGAVKG
jgi:ABC-type glycerol-3-phosphate transport system permease component